MSDGTQPLLSVEELSVHFSIQGGMFRRTNRLLRAVNRVSLTLTEGECLSVVGESGCGKSTLALSIVGLQEPTSGTIRFQGRPISGEARPSRVERARMAQIVFQDPYASLNPRQSVFASLAGPLRLHGVTDRAEIATRVERIMTLVGLNPEQAQRFPHEFSGGQRQRIGIARALILDPKIVVLDEPVSALDVSIRAQIINLLLELKDALGLSYIMISHDLSVVEHMSDRVAVMYFGQLVESGPWDKVFANPRHPYTRRLIGAIPDPFAELSGRPHLQPEDVPPPDGFRYYPDTFGKHEIYSAPPESELLQVDGGHLVRLMPIVI